MERWVLFPPLPDGYDWIPSSSHHSESLCGCFEDCGSCCYGYWCTPCLFGSNTEKIDGSNCVLMCCAYSLLTSVYLCWIPHYMKRKELRMKYGLREDPSCGDCPTTLCCSPCALCQEARFLKNRGQLQWIRSRSYLCLHSLLANPSHVMMAPGPQTMQPGRNY